MFSLTESDKGLQAQFSSNMQFIGKFVNSAKNFISSKESSRRHIIRGEILQCEAIAQRFVAQQSVELFSQAGLGVMNVVLCHRAVAASCGVEVPELEIPKLRDIPPGRRAVTECLGQAFDEVLH